MMFRKTEVAETVSKECFETLARRVETLEAAQCELEVTVAKLDKEGFEALDRRVEALEAARRELEVTLTKRDAEITALKLDQAATVLQLEETAHQSRKAVTGLFDRLETFQRRLPSALE